MRILWSESITIDETTITMRLLPKGQVHWCSHWELIDRLVALGYLRRENGGPDTMGHCEYYFVKPQPRVGMPRISKKLVGHAVWFKGFNDVTYRGNIAQVRNGVVKVHYMLATAIPVEKAEYGVATAYLDKNDWSRLELA